MGLLTSIAAWLADKLGGHVVDRTLNRPRFALTVESRPAAEADGAALDAELWVRVKANGADLNVDAARIETEPDADRLPVTACINMHYGEGEPAVLVLPFPIEEGTEHRCGIPLGPVQAEIARRRPARRGQRITCRLFVRDERRDVEKKSNAFQIDIPLREAPPSDLPED